MPQNTQSRRAFIKHTALLGTGFTINALGCAAGLRTIETTGPDGRLVVDTSTIKELATVGGTIQVGNPQVGNPLILVRTGDNEFQALSSTCPHLGCQVRKTRFGFRCPCHGSAFDLQGQVTNGPANEPLPSYNVDVSGAVVTIYL